MRPADTLVVTRLDRLGRNMVETVTTISDLADRDINVRVLILLWTHPVLQIRSWSTSWLLAEWERDLLIQRTREGVAHARAQGRVAGPKPKLSKEQKQQAALLVENGQSVKSVARSFNVSRQTIYRAIREVDDTK